LSSPKINLSKKQSESGTEILFDESSPALDRHEWFERTYSTNGWVIEVTADRLRIEKEREEAKTKKEKESKVPKDPPAPAPDVPLPKAPKADPSA
jgi:hypothetical protein